MPRRQTAPRPRARARPTARCRPPCPPRQMAPRRRRHSAMRMRLTRGRVRRGGVGPAGRSLQASRPMPPRRPLFRSPDSRLSSSLVAHGPRDARVSPSPPVGRQARRRRPLAAQSSAGLVDVAVNRRPRLGDSGRWGRHMDLLGPAARRRAAPGGQPTGPGARPHAAGHRLGGNRPKSRARVAVRSSTRDGVRRPRKPRPSPRAALAAPR